MISHALEYFLFAVYGSGLQWQQLLFPLTGSVHWEVTDGPWDGAVSPPWGGHPGDVLLSSCPSRQDCRRGLSRPHSGLSSGLQGISLSEVWNLSLSLVCKKGVFPYLLHWFGTLLEGLRELNEIPACLP